MKKLLKIKNTDLNPICRYKFPLNGQVIERIFTPLHIACREGNYEIAKLLLEDERVDVNKPHNFGGSPFYIACAFGKVDIVELMIKNQRIDINKPSYEGYTPLSVSCFYEKTEVVNLLLKDQRIEMNKPNKNDETPFYIACQENRVAVVKILMKDDRLDVNNYKKQEISPLGASIGDKQIFQLLIEDGRVNLCAKGRNNRTVFHLICQLNPSVEFIEMLIAIERDFKIDALDHFGFTAKTLAKAKGNQAIVGLIEEVKKDREMVAKRLREKLGWGSLSLNRKLLYYASDGLFMSINTNAKTL